MCTPDFFIGIERGSEKWIRKDELIPQISSKLLFSLILQTTNVTLDAPSSEPINNFVHALIIGIFYASAPID